MNLKIYTKNIEEKAKKQIYNLLDQDAFKKSKVRIMPDVHAGSGCVIGFTANLGDKVIPQIVGVDIGCGMTWVKTNLNKKDIDLSVVDKIINEKVPSGFSVREKPLDVDINKKIYTTYCAKELKNKENYLEKSLGSLGGGNHFIEIDEDKNGKLIFVVHSGSRNFGKQVCEIYQDKAIKYCSCKEQIKKETEEIINKLKAEHKENLITSEIKKLKYKYYDKMILPKEICYVEGKDRDDYLHDMKICQKWATINRKIMLETILDSLKEIYGNFDCEWNETIHNYIGDDNIVRKGAISAYKNEIVLIPINMRDGCVIGKGKGNEDWNCSAPHGAGRVMSRMEANEKLNLEDYENSMKNVYTTSVCKNTIDEAPMVYKSMDEIIENMKDTVEVIDIIKPIYNFKAKD